MADIFEIAGRIHSTSQEEVTTVAGEILDENKGMKQSQINTETDAALDDRYTKEQTYSKSELNNLITTPNQQYVNVTANSQTTAVTDVLPATGEADTTYRVGNWDGTQYNDSVFSEYAWNGSAYIKLSTKSQVGEVYDISANHADTKYADLAAALNGGANIPQSLQKGGMSVKYVCSYDNKYVQYRLTKDTWSTTVSDWQGIDDIVDNLNYINNIVRFKVGSLNSETGAEVVVNTRARTAFIKSPFILELNEGYKIQMICKYQQNPDGTTTFIDLSGVRSNLTKYFGTSDDGYVYRLTVSKDVATDTISESDLNDIIKTFKSCVVFEDTNNLLGLAGKKVSVCGASNECFEGVSVGRSLRYYPGSNIVGDMDNTYWGMLIKTCGAVLEENISVGSSGVTDNEYYHQNCFRKRVANGGLGSPDVVLLGGGQNEPPIGDEEGQMQVGTFDPTKPTEELNLYEFCDAYDNLIRLINSECSNPRIIIYIHPKTDYRLASVMTGIGRYYGADIINAVSQLDKFELLQEVGISPSHYTQHDMTLVYNLIVNTLLEKGKHIQSVYGTNGKVSELYFEGIDTTKHYSFQQLRYVSGTGVRIFIKDEYGETLSNTTIAQLNHNVNALNMPEGMKGYITLNMTEDDTIDIQATINNDIATSLDENPSIHAFLIENGIIPVIQDNKADKGGITWINRVIIRSNGLLGNYNSDTIFTSGLLLIDKSEDIKVKNGWYNKDNAIVPLYFYDENGIAISGYLDDLSDPTTGRKSFTIQKDNIPANAKYIRICSNYGSTVGYADVLSGISLYSVANEVFKISRKNTKRESTNEYELYGEETFNEHYYINSTSGAITGSNNYIATPFLNIKGAASLEVALFFNSVTSNNNGLGFYDKDKNFISGVANHDTVPYAVLTINVPQNAEYIAVCMPTENNSFYSYNTSVNGVPCYIKVNYRYVEKRGFTEGNFDTQGSYTTPSSTYNNNTGQINISEGEVLEYRAFSNLNDVIAVIYDDNNNILLQGTNLVSRGIIHETLVAPAGASYAIVYTRNTSWSFTPANFIPLAKIYRKRYGRNIDIDAFDEAIAEMRKGTLSEAQEKKIEDMVFGNNADFENASVIDYNPPVVASVSSDDALEGYIQHTPNSVVSQGGFFSRLYPVCETAGQIPSCEAVEYQRVVDDVESGMINNAGKAMRALCVAKGWEAMNHSMTARFTAAYAFDTFADAMTAVSNHTINPVGEGVKSNGTTHIYIRDRKANYYYTKAAGTYSTDASDWLIVPYQYIKPKLWNTSGTYISLNPTYPYDYQTRVAQKRISEVLDTSVETYVAASDSNSYKLRKYALTTHKQSVFSATRSDIDFTYKNGIVKMPLVSNIARIGGYDLGEDSRIVVASNTEYNTWKDKFDELVRRGTKAFINAFHIYRYCWENRVPDDADVPTAAKVDTVSGGTYPESWILPVRKPQDFPDDFLPPHPNTGLDRWGSFTMQDDGSIVDEAGVKVMDENGDFVQYSTTCWMPCYGTRLFQFWRFLLYIHSTGVEFMTIRDNVARLYNRLSVGSFPYAYNNAAFKVSDEPADMSYYFIGADGSKLYHKATL